MFAWAFLAALPALQTPDGKLGERVRALVERLGDEDFETREKAEKELLGLPARCAPEVARLAGASDDLEIRTRAANAVLPEPWPSLLGGTIAEAQASLSKIRGAGAGHGEAVDRAVAALERRPEPALLEKLLASPEAGPRNFALAVMARWPPKDPGLLVRHLEGDTAWRASRALVAAGDASVVPAVLEIFAKAGAEAAHAADVLEHFGPGEKPDRLADLLLAEESLRRPGLRILARAGPKAEDALLRLFDRLPARQGEIVEALARVGSDKSLPAVRAWFKEKAPDSAERRRILFLLRDPFWAREQLAERRRAAADLYRLEFDEIAAAGGAALRDEVLDVFDDPALKVGLQRELLVLLGAVGRREDGALIAQKLEDRRLRDAAAEALDRIGDPRHAAALMKAFRRGRGGLELQRAVLALPASAVEDALVEILSDAETYSAQDQAALRLAERALTSRLRETLYKGILEGELGWTSLRAEAARILAPGAGKDDLPRIEKLRAHQGRDATVRVCGLLLAVRAGDAAAAPELAGIVGGGEKFFLPHPLAASWNDGAHLLEWAAPAGEAWRKAVAEAWRGKREWLDGAIWLAGQGMKDAQDFLRERRARLPAAQAARADRALAARGERDALERLFAQAATRNYLSFEDERAFLAGAGPELKARVIEEARKRTRFASHPFLRLAALLKDPRAVPVYRAVVARDPTAWGGVNEHDLVTGPCARALGRLMVAEAIPDLRVQLRSMNARNRAEAALALGDLGDREAIPFLVRLVDDPFEVEAEDARQGTEYLLRPLRRVWDAAMEALEKVTGEKPAGESTAERRAFWRARYGER